MAAGYSLPVFSCFPTSKQRYAYNGTVSRIDLVSTKFANVHCYQTSNPKLFLPLLKSII